MWAVWIGGGCGVDRFSVRFCLANRLANPKKRSRCAVAIVRGCRWDEGTGAYLWRGRLRSTAAYDIRGGGTAAPLGRDRRGCSRAGGGRGARAPPAREPARERRRGAGRAWEPRSWARGCPCRRRDRLPCRLMARWEDKRDRVGQRTSERHGIETASREEGMGVSRSGRWKKCFSRRSRMTAPERAVAPATRPPI